MKNKIYNRIIHKYVKRWRGVKNRKGVLKNKRKETKSGKRMVQLKNLFDMKNIKVI
jgi:hypothetical protein